MKVLMMIALLMILATSAFAAPQESLDTVKQAVLCAQGQSLSDAESQMNIRLYQNPAYAQIRLANNVLKVRTPFIVSNFTIGTTMAACTGSCFIGETRPEPVICALVTSKAKSLSK